MMQQPLCQMETQWRDTTAIVTLEGEIDRSNAGQLFIAISMSTSDATDIVLDTSGLTYLDSAALTMIHKIADLAKPLVIVAPAGTRARRLLEIAGMDTVLRIEETQPATRHSSTSSIESSIRTDGNPAI